MNQQKFDEFEVIFHPKSIAVVGTTRKKVSGPNILFDNMHKSGFQGNIYPVNPSGDEILGVKSYPRVSDIPEPVDYVLIGVPARAIPGVIDNLTGRGVKVISVFTAGFSEVGTSEGRRLEEELVQKARKSGIRVIGPNCLGVIYNSSIKLASVDMGLPYKRTAEIGSVGIIAQSGGVALRTSSMALARGMPLSKVVSYGNGSDLDGVDYLEYFAADPDTEIIGLYIEGLKDGRRLFQLLRQVCQTKPVVMLKGGRTEAGAEVAASHTGSLATSYSVWKAMSKQLGVILVENQDEFVDTLLAFYCLGEFKGQNVGFISSFTDGGGGDSVAAADIFSSHGFEVPPFSEKTRTLLQSILPAEGTILRNPLDASLVMADLKLLEDIIGSLADDSRIDMVVFHEYLRELLGGTSNKETAQNLNDIFIRLNNRQSKPVVAVSASGFPTSPEQWEIERQLVAAKVPVYHSQEAAARAIARVRQYYHCRESIKNT